MFFFEVLPVWSLPRRFSALARWSGKNGRNERERRNGDAGRRERLSVPAAARLGSHAIFCSPPRAEIWKTLRMASDSESPHSRPSPSSRPGRERILAYRPYEKLLSYQRSNAVYLATVKFTERFLRPGDRTIDQMVQAARSGKQNIVEGSMAGAGSRQSELFLTNVARASLAELLEDYRDFLNVRRERIWEPDSRESPSCGGSAGKTAAPTRITGNSSKRVRRRSSPTSSSC